MDGLDLTGGASEPTPPPDNYGTQTNIVAGQTGVQDTYQPIGLTLAPGHTRTAALTVVAAPLVLLLVLIVHPWSLFNSGSGNFGGATYGSAGNGYNTGFGGGSDGGAQSPLSQPSDTTAADSPSPSPSPSDTDLSLFGFGTPTDSASADATDSGSPSVTPTATGDGPGAVVISYYDAIDSQDYQTAWNLGGKNLGGTYDQFVAGFANTTTDNPHIASVDGNQVSITLNAVDSDGTQHDFSGTYTVDNGEITGSHITQID